MLVRCVQITPYNAEMSIYLTQVTPISCGRADSGVARHFTRDLYGTGSTATACCRSPKNSLPRLRDFRRLKRKVNSSIQMAPDSPLPDGFSSHQPSWTREITRWTRAISSDGVPFWSFVKVTW